MVAVGSRDRARGEAFAAEHGIARVHGSYEELLADPDVEAVYIPLPNSLHVPWSVQALEAGKHVLCEKPLTRRVGRGRGGVRRRRARRPAADGGVHVALPPADRGARAARRARSRRCGSCAPRSASPLGDDPANVRLQGELDGGSLMDVGCYCVSALRLLGGEPERVSGEAVAGGERRRRALRRRAAASRATCSARSTAGFDVPPRGGIEVVGEGGTLVAEDPWHGQSPRLTRDGEEIPVEAANPYGLELEDFSAAIREGRPPRLGREDAVGQARAIEMLYAAAG